MAGRKRTRSAKQVPSVHRLAWLISTLAVCLAALGILTVHYRSSVRPENVVLVSIDTLHAGHLSCYGYQRIQTPNLDRLAKQGALFEHATTTVPLTLPAHASIFTGRNPFHHGVVDNFTSYLGEEEETLAEVLRGHGFATGAFIGAFVLDSSWGVAQGFDEYFDHFDVDGLTAASIEGNERRGDEVLERALNWIRKPREEPFFLFIHFYDPHAPYDPPAPFRDGCDSSPVDCYDGEVAFVDSLVGDLIAELEAAGFLEETLVVALGDHGESLGAHGESTHGFFLYDATVGVPLIMKGPGIPGSTRIGTQVRTVDVLPSILDLLGLPCPSSVDGVSLRPLLLEPNRDLKLVAYLESQYPRIQFGWAPLSGLRTERYKFIDAPRRELYDVALDPGETHNLVDEKPDIVSELDSALKALREESTLVERGARLPDPETMERLRALGYVVAPPTGSSDGSRQRADPKDKIEVFNRLSDARVANQRGDADVALRLLVSVVEEDPEIALAHLMMGNIHLEEGDFRSAEAAFRTVLDRNGEDVEAWFGLAVAHRRMKMYEAAATELERCLELDPRQTRAVEELAELSLSMGDAGRAERLLLDRGGIEGDMPAKLLLADALLSQDKVEEALTILDAIERSGQEDERIMVSLGSLFLKAGHEERAVAAYRRAVQAPAPDRSRPSREEAEVLNGIGPILARHGDANGAALAFQKAAERDPSLASPYNNLGIVRAQAGQLDAAEQAFLQAIEREPDFAEAYYNLGNLYLQAGNGDRALSMFRRALEIKPDYAKARAKLEQLRAHRPEDR